VINCERREEHGAAQSRAYKGAASVYTKIRGAVAGVALAQILIAWVTQQAACRDTTRQIVLQLA